MDVLRRGIRHRSANIDLFYGTPSPGNDKAKELFRENRFSVTRQLRYSRDETQRALDIVLFINGLPILTFELKNRLTKQTVADAVVQYRTDRNPREPLFQRGRCLAHFAVDENEVRFCTHLQGKASWDPAVQSRFQRWSRQPSEPRRAQDRLPLARGAHPSESDQHRRELRPDHRDEEREDRSEETRPDMAAISTARRGSPPSRRRRQRGSGKALPDPAFGGGAGRATPLRVLAHQLIGLRKDDTPVFDSIVVVTDRVLLDRQIRDTIRQYAQVGALVGHADRSGDLRQFIESGKKIIISTVQKFPVILDEIGNEHSGRRFAIIIDEAHSSQGGRTSAAMAQALSGSGEETEDATYEDMINDAMGSRKLLSNASYFAFTATPKNKTLEIFGDPDPQPDGTVRHRAFHGYTMKQAIQEGFILDVLAHYTPVLQLLPHRQDRGGRPGIRCQEGAQETAPASWRDTTTRSASRPRSWWTTSTTWFSRRARWEVKPARWW